MKMELEELSIPKTPYEAFCKDYRTYLKKLDEKGRINSSTVMDWCIKYCELKNDPILMKTFARAAFNPNFMYALCKMGGDMDALSKKLKVNPREISNYYSE